MRRRTDGQGFATRAIHAGQEPDAPFGAEGGASYIRETMKVLASLDISTGELVASSVSARISIRSLSGTK